MVGVGEETRYSLLDPYSFGNLLTSPRGCKSCPRHLYFCCFADRASRGVLFMPYIPAVASKPRRNKSLVPSFSFLLHLLSRRPGGRNSSLTLPFLLCRGHQPLPGCFPSEALHRPRGCSFPGCPGPSIPSKTLPQPASSRMMLMLFSFPGAAGRWVHPRHRDVSTRLLRRLGRCSAGGKRGQHTSATTQPPLYPASGSDNPLCL